MLNILFLVFLLSLLIQVGYLLWIERGMGRGVSDGEAEADDDDDMIPVSVIIAARDEAANLGKLLPDLLAQDHPNFEIIIVDNESTDATWSILQGYSDPRLKPIRSGPSPKTVNPKKWAIEKGISASSKEYLVFTDADVRIPSTSWLSNMSRGFSSGKDIVLGVSPYFKGKGWLNRFIRFETLFTALMYIGWALNERSFMGVGRNMGYRRSLFTDHRGFEGIRNVKGGDDDLFINRHANSNNVSVVLGEENLVWSYPERSLIGFLMQKVRHLSVGTKYRMRDRLGLGGFILSHALLVFTGVVLLLSGFMWLVVLLGWLARMIFFIPAFKRALTRFGVSFESQYLIILDFVYPFYYFSISIGTIWVKSVPWKTKDNSLTRLSKISAS